MVKVKFKQRNLSCYVIGEESLAIQCMEILLAQCFTILGIVTSNLQLIEWATKHSIVVIPPNTHLENVLIEKVDYLFSIVNPAILSDKLIKNVRKFAINYHDSLLPRYAGVHATSWALLNQEKTHGVTWHLIDNKIDAGDVLKQAIVSIDKGETALSLNLKCYQAAIESFNDLVGELVTDTYQRKSQDLRHRTYYASNQKPIANGWVNWNDSAENIERMFGALNLGDHPNRLGTLKFVVNNKFYIISDLRLSKTPSNKPPGTLIKFTQDEMHVTTQTTNIIITQLRTVFGNVCEFSSVNKLFKVGKRLYSPSIKLQSAYQKRASELCKYESYWVKALLQSNATKLPFLENEEDGDPNNRNFACLAQFKLTRGLQNKLSAKLGKSITTQSILFAIWIVYLYRIHSQEMQSVQLTYPALLQKANKFSNLLATYVPFSMRLPEDGKFKHVLKLVENKLLDLEKHDTFLEDIYARFNTLKNADHNRQSTAVLLQDLAQPKPLFSHAINLVITQKGMSFYVNKNVLNENLRIFINNIPGHLENIVTNYVLKTNKAIGEFSLLTPLERKKVLKEWNQTKTGYPRHKTIPQLFQEQASKTPDDVAVMLNNETCTYRQLNEKSNQLAHYLRKQGVKNGQLVAICIEQSLAMIIGLLGVIKAGAAYVPIDPEYPQERVNYILQDTKAKLLLTNKAILNKFKYNANYLKNIITLEEVMLDKFSIGPLINQRVIPASTLYVMYTSGSTGKPKGVIVSHRNVVKLVKNIDYIKIDARDCIAQASNFAFDASTFEIWGALLNGAKLIIIPKDILLDNQRFSESITKNKISILWLTSALFNHLYKQNAQILHSIPKLLVGGEKLNTQIIKQFVADKGNKAYFLMNGYGPTECTTFSVCYKVPKDIASFSSIPIGKPINNTRCYILDKFFQPVPIGVVGELYIGGEGVAKGYLSQPNQNKEKFFPDRFQRRESTKLYKTGDMVQWLPNGLISYIGRVDEQIKIRGFRVELSEIELALSQYPLVSQAVTIVQDVSTTNKQLIAFFVLKKNNQTKKHSPNPKAIQDFLKKWLPHYMIPSVFYEVDYLPLTKNGKIDRAVLLEWSLSHSSLSSHALAMPQNKIQSELAEIWQKLFKLDKVGIDDDFFALGGDSIIAMQLITEASQHGIHLSIKNIFNYPTIAQLSVQVKHEKSTENKKISLSGNVPLTPIQQWFFEKPLKKIEQFSHACLITIHGEVDINRLKRCLLKLVAQYDAFGLRFSKKGDHWRQYYDKAITQDVDAIFKHIDISNFTESKTNDVIQKLSYQLQEKFNLEKGPLLQVVLLTNKKTKTNRLLMVVHHLVIDGFSWRVLLEDLEKLYETNHLLANTCTYQQWTKAVNQYAKSKQLGFAKQKWRAIYQAGNKFVLPQDYCLGENLEKSSETITMSLTKEETDILSKVVTKEHDVKFNELLIAILAKTIGQWTGSHSVLLDLEGHGREEISSEVNLSHTVGWYTSLYPVYFAYDQAMTLSDTIKAVKKQLQGLPTNSIDYGVLRYLSNEKKLTLDPPISFNYWGKFDSIFSKESLFKFNWLKLISNPDNPRTHLLNIEAVIQEGKLCITWIYSKSFHRQQTIQKLSDYYCNSLHEPIKNHLQNVSSNIIRLPKQNLIEWKLAPLQKGLLFHSVAKPASEMYTVQLTCKLTKKVDVLLLKKAFQILIEKHAILRTCFKWEKLPEPIQAIQEKVELTWQEYHWPHLTIKEYTHRFEDFIKADRQAGFALNQAPLMRVTLIKCDEHHQLILCFHHIILDGWSTFLFLKELGQIYSILVEGGSIQQLPLASYRQYIDWIYQHNLDKVEPFWYSYLKGYSTPTRLSFFQTEGIDTKEIMEYRSHVLTLSSSLTQAIHDFCRSQKLTASTFFQGMWALLLSRYERQKDILFGVTVSVRPAEIVNVNQIMGLMVNTLPFRVVINEDVPVIEFLQNIQANLTELMEYAYAPLANIQAWAENTSHEALFNSVFVFENYPICNIPALGIETNSIQIVDPTHYPLVVAVLPGERVKLKFCFDANQISPSAIDLASEHIQVLIKEFLGKYLQPLRQTSGLTDAEFKQLNYKGNTVSSKSSINQITHHVGEKVTKTPDYVSRIHQEQVVTSEENISISGRYTPAKNLLEKQLTHIWSKVLNISKIGVEDNFFEIGGHSLSSLEVLSHIQIQFGIDLPLRIFLQYPTICGLVEIIHSFQDEKMAFKAATMREQSCSLPVSLIPLRTKGSKKPLFLIHPIGGTVFWYISLTKYLDSERPLYGIQDPGIEAGKGKIPYKSIEEMASAYIKMISTVQSEGSYLIAGASAGATISIEMTRQFLSQGKTVEFIGLLDGWAPFPDMLRNQELFEANMRRQYHAMQKEFLAKGILHAEALLELQWCRSQMIAQYKLPVLPNKLTLFKAMDTVDVFQPIEAPLNHWEGYSKRSIDLHKVPGDHESMFQEPNVAILGQKLNNCLTNIDR